MSRKQAIERAFVIVAICIVIGMPMYGLFTTGSVAVSEDLAAFTAHMDRRIPQLMKDYSVPGISIALIQEGEPTWAKAYGYADLNQNRGMTTDNLLMAQSISKSVSAWGVMKLVEQGILGLDDPVMEHIRGWDFPDSPFSAQDVTIRQLLSLSAGLPLGDITLQYSPREKIPALTETLSGDNVRLTRTPGSAFSYSNTSFALLELLIEEVTGRDFAEFMEEEILTPLGMHNSSFTWREGYDAKVPTGYDLKGKPVSAYVNPDKASGGLIASVGDLASFVSAGMLNQERAPENMVLTEYTIGQLYTEYVEIPGIFGVVSDAYGFGHFVERLPSGHQAVWHGGQGNGWMTHFHSVPETGDGIVILTNSQRSWPLFSHVLGDWAKWNGFSSVGMATIAWAEMGLQILIGLTLVCSLWQLWQLGVGYASQKRRFAPLCRQDRLLRIGQLALFMLLVSGLLWSIRQDYLLITSVFPAQTASVGVALLIAALVSLAYACFPRHLDKGQTSSSQRY